MRSGWIRTWAVVLLAGAATALTAAPALADDGLASAYPAAGAVIGSPPPVATLRLKDDVRSASATVTDGCGRTVPGAVRVAGRRVSIRLAIDHRDMTAQDHSKAGGAWRIAWRAVGTDGDRTSGKVTFTVGGEARCDVLPQVVKAGHLAAEDESGEAPASGGIEGDGSPAGAPSGGTVPIGPLLAVASIGVLLTFVQLLVRRRGVRSGG